MSKYKILSLDGGGSWALLQIKALQQIYGANALGHDVLKNFNLVVANSGGSVAMAAMLKNLPLSYILNNYYLKESVLQTIFVKLPNLKIEKLIRDVIGVGPKYSAAKKLPGMREVLNSTVNGSIAVGDTRVVDLPNLLNNNTQFVIVAFDYDSRKEVFFRSNLNSKAQSSGNAGAFASVTLAQAIHASSNAPVQFFDAPAQFPVGSAEYNFWDGAMGGYNNPVAAGVIEALADEVDKNDICVLSIGTGNTMLPVKGHVLRTAVSDDLYQPVKNSSLPNDIEEAATTVLDDPPDAATFTAYMLLGNIPIRPNPTAPIAPPKNIVRLNALIQPVVNSNNNWDYPAGITADQFKTLVDMDMAAVDQSQVDLINQFGNAWISGDVNNQGIRHNPDTTIDIGYSNFAEAVAAWNNCNNNI